MENENIHTGFFEINGKRLSSEVLSWANCYHLHTGELKSRIFIDLYVFNPSLLSRLDDKSLSEGIRYAISGPKCASISRGPLGHPGDGEYDLWDVENIELFFNFQNRQLHVQLTGTSIRGSGGFSRAKDDLDPLQFKVGFTVRNDELKKYLQLTDSAWGYFQEKLTKAQEPTNA